MAKKTKPARTVTKSAKAEKKTQKTAYLFGEGTSARAGRNAAPKQVRAAVPKAAIRPIT